MVKNVLRIPYYMQKLTGAHDLPFSRRKKRYVRLLNYKNAMMEELKKDTSAKVPSKYYQ